MDPDDKNNESNKNLFSQNDLKFLKQATDLAVAGRSPSLQIKDRTLIDPALEEIKKLSKISEHRLTDESEPEFVLLDFRKGSPEEIVNNLESQFPNRGPDFKKNNPGKVFVLIDPYDDRTANFPSISSVVKWGAAIIIYSRDFEDSEPQVQKMLGEYALYDFQIGQKK